MASNLEVKIQRIAGNVAAALAKIAEKGVAAPDTANSDNLEFLIDAIAGTEDLTDVLTVQDELITQLEAAVTNKAGGGVGIKTCTVTVNGAYYISNLATTTFDGTAISSADFMTGEDVIEIQNVVKGATVIVVGDGRTQFAANISGGEFIVDNTPYVMIVRVDGDAIITLSSEV